MRYLRRWLVGGVMLFTLACTSSPAAPTSPSAVAPPASAPAAPPASAPAAPSASAPTAPAASAPAAPTAAPTPVAMRRLELPTATLNANITPLWVGADHGVFQRYGFDVEVQGLSPATATQALQSGSVLFAGTAGSTVSAYVSGARDLVFIAGLLNKALFQLVAQPDIASVGDLRGKSVASTTAGASPSVALADVLRRYGLEPERDVNFVYLRDQPGILTGLVSGQVPAGFMGSPFNTQAINQGYRLLVDTADLDMPLAGLNMTTTRGLLEREPELARRFVMAYVESIALARREPGLAIESLLRGTRSEDRPAAEEAYALYSKAWDPWPSAKALDSVLETLDVPGARDVHSAQMIDDSILRQLETSGWLAEHYRAR
jgi:ABC-type nitrate/sulfonate/bicarbonate transport system substrate-binding protein